MFDGQINNSPLKSAIGGGNLTFLKYPRRSEWSMH